MAEGKEGKEVVYSAQTRIDFYKIRIYLAEKVSPTFAKGFVDEVKNKIETSIKHNPLIYSECPELATKKKTYRNCPFLGYRIIYKVTPARIYIISIVHGARGRAYIRKLKRN